MVGEQGGGFSVHAVISKSQSAASADKEIKKAIHGLFCAFRVSHPEGADAHHARLPEG